MRFMAVLIAQPVLALLPALILVVLFARTRSRPALWGALAWVLYALYEMGMKLRILCTGECNIRVDLLLIYPALVVLSVFGLVAAARARSTRG
jgi:hypothetical protein